MVVKSTCQADGLWSQSEPLPPGPLDFPSALATPSMEDMPCFCQALNLTYNPIKEKGAQFFCNPPIDWKGLPAKITSSTQCSLLCDLMLVATIECRDGRWTGQPEAGWWCSEERGGVGRWRGQEEGKAEEEVMLVNTSEEVLEDEEVTKV